MYLQFYGEPIQITTDGMTQCSLSWLTNLELRSARYLTAKRDNICYYTSLHLSEWDSSKYLFPEMIFPYKRLLALCTRYTPYNADAFAGGVLSPRLWRCDSKVT